MMKRILLSLAAAVMMAAPLHAQPFRSDVTGPRVTGSEVAGYPVLPTRDVEGAIFRPMPGGRTAFRSRAVADAALAEADAAQRAACSGTLQPPPDWPRELAMALDSAAQRIVCGLLAGRRDEAARVLAALRNCAGADAAQAEALVRALEGILVQRPPYLDERQRYVDGDRWQEAIRAYQAFIASAPDAVMDSPPAELAVIGLILDRVVEAGLRAAER